MSEIDQKREAWHLQSQDENTQKQVARVAEERIWALLVDNVNENLELSGDERLLDVGCGNAYLLSRLNINANKVCGVDFASNMVEEARKRLPAAHFNQGEACDISFSGPFQRVLSYSIFHYFPDIQYVEFVINRLIALTEPKGIILIGDLLDSQFEAQIKSNSDLNIEASLPIIHRYSQWLFVDLKRLASYLVKHPRVASAELIQQPSEFTLSWYRKDLKITLN